MRIGQAVADMTAPSRKTVVFRDARANAEVRLGEQLLWAGKPIHGFTSLRLMPSLYPSSSSGKPTGGRFADSLRLTLGHLSVVCFGKSRQVYHLIFEP